MVIHLIEDNTFARKAIRLFNSLSDDENLFLLNSRGNPDVAKKYSEFHNVIVGCADKTYLDAIGKLDQANLVVFHNLLDNYKIELLRNLKKGSRVHWLTWGGDLYCAPRWRYAIFGPLTEKYLCERLSFKGKFVRSIGRKFPQGDLLMDRLRYGVEGSLYDRIKSVIHKVTSASAVVDTEKEIISSEFSRKIQYFPFAYGSIEDYVQAVDQTSCRGDTGGGWILVGNSAYPSNNHLEAFEIIQADKTLSRRNILVPLAYGDQEYAKFIESEGIARFGRNFHALRSFVPLQDYLELLGKCDIAIMNQYRQQAVGNILGLLHMGIAVYMNASSPVYKAFSSLGLDVFDLDEGDFSKSVNVEINRTILNDVYSRSSSVAKARNIIQGATTHSLD